MLPRRLKDADRQLVFSCTSAYQRQRQPPLLPVAHCRQGPAKHQRSVCGRLTEEMTERYRSVAQSEVWPALVEVGPHIS